MKLLGFDLPTNIWVHAMPLALILDGVRSRGIDVVHASCGGVIDRHCVAMDEAGLTQDAAQPLRASVCRSCAARANLLVSTFDFSHRVLKDYLTNVDFREADALIQAADPGNFDSVQIDGLPIGRYAAYEFILKNKLTELRIPQHLQSAYQGQLRSALLVNFAAPRLLEDVDPDAAITYNTLYSMNRVFMAHCERRRISCYSLQGGAHLRRKLETFTLYRDDRSRLGATRSAACRKFMSESIGEPESRAVMDSVKELFLARSPFVYSTPHVERPTAGTRDSLGLRADRKTALVALSSHDEMFAADTVGCFSEPVQKSFLFPDQTQWIKHICRIAECREDLQFIVRLHPREFPNKREDVLSANAGRLASALEGAPGNVIPDWPSDGRSLFEVMQVCDVVLSGWSSVGVEAALCGMPVVAYKAGELLPYPPEMVSVVNALDEYEPAIDAEIRRGVTVDRVIAAFRWFAFSYMRLSIDMTGHVPPRATWSLRRILQGMRNHSRFPVPLTPILALESRELRKRRGGAMWSYVVADTLLQNRSSLAESVAWPERPAVTMSEELQSICQHISEIVRLLGGLDDPASLASRLYAASAVHLAESHH